MDSKKTEKPPGKTPEVNELPLEQTQGRLLKKVELTVKTYPDLEPFLQMAVLLLEGVYEYMTQVGSSSRHSYI